MMTLDEILGYTTGRLEVNADGNLRWMSGLIVVRPSNDVTAMILDECWRTSFMAHCILNDVATTRVMVS